MPNYYEVIPLSQDALLARLAGQNLGTWCKFITLHNTSAPSLAQWAHNRNSYSAKQLVINMEAYFRQLGWHTGPHYLVTPEPDTPIFEMSDPSAPGVHASCFNLQSIGIEMVGEYNLEDFNSGAGAAVRDSAVLLLAALHNKLRLTPLPFIYDQSGLHFHKDCARDHHDCPGKNVDRPTIISLIQGKMRSLAAPAPASAAMVAKAKARPRRLRRKKTTRGRVRARHK
jgi:N-acetylmuramoyl-L-alanine amidase